MAQFSEFCLVFEAATIVFAKYFLLLCYEKWLVGAATEEFVRVDVNKDTAVVGSEGTGVKREETGVG